MSIGGPYRTGGEQVSSESETSAEKLAPRQTILSVEFTVPGGSIGYAGVQTTVLFVDWWAVSLYVTQVLLKAPNNPYRPAMLLLVEMLSKTNVKGLSAGIDTMGGRVALAAKSLEVF